MQVYVVSLYAGALDDDVRLHGELEGHLQGTLTGLPVSFWHTGQLAAGQDREAEWQRQVRRADIILMLLTAELQARCAGWLREALEQRRRGARVIPILGRPLFLEGTCYADLQALPRGGRAVASFGPERADRDLAWMEVVGELRAAVREHLGTAGLGAFAHDRVRFYEALCRLDFKRQLRLARGVLGREPVAAFAIHGPRGHGQRWLLNRILDPLPGKVIPFDAARLLGAPGVDDLWRDLAPHVGLRRGSAHRDIARQVATCRRTRHVLLRLDNVQVLDGPGLGAIIDGFWGRLAGMAEEEAEAGAQKLLMFFIDSGGDASRWSPAGPAAGPFDRRVPLMLPVTDSFTAELLTNWFLDEMMLPGREAADPERAARAILARSDNGVPEYTFEALCELVGEDWLAREAEWMRY